jgi:hypothetical protein
MGYYFVLLPGCAILTAAYAVLMTHCAILTVVYAVLLEGCAILAAICCIYPISLNIFVPPQVNNIKYMK